MLSISVKPLAGAARGAGGSAFPPPTISRRRFGYCTFTYRTLPLAIRSTDGSMVWVVPNCRGVATGSIVLAKSITASQVGFPPTKHSGTQLAMTP